MKTDKILLKFGKTHKINLTHIATSYPHSFDIDDDTYAKIFKASSTSDAIDTFLSNKLGMDWDKDFFFDSISHIKI